ncbi:MAG: AsmA family protein [Planctomycetota bacterium]
MKLFKILLGVVIVVVLLLVAAVVGAFVFIDSVARSGVEQGASYALDVPTTLDSADVDVFGGTVDLAGLTIDNPEGYDTPHFFRLDSASAALDTGTLQSDVVEMSSLVIDGIDVYLDKEGGKANYEQILENLKRFESGEPPEDETEADPNATGKTFVIREVKILNVTAHVELLPLGGELTRSEIIVPEIILSDVGEKDPLTVATLTNILIKSVFASIVNVGGGALPGAIADGLNAGLGGLTDLATSGIGMGVDLGEGVINVVGDVGGAAGQAIGDAAGVVGETVGEGVEGATDAVGEGLGRVTDRVSGGVSGLFGGGDDEDDEAEADHESEADPEAEAEPESDGGGG